MSLMKFAQSIGAVRQPSFSLDDGQSAVVFVDRGKEPRPLFLHDLGKAGNRVCTRQPDCLQCKAGVPRKEKYIVAIERVCDDGTVTGEDLWLTRMQVGRFACAADNDTDGGTARVLISSEVEIDDEGNKKPKPAGTVDDGPYWHSFIFRNGSTTFDGGAGAGELAGSGIDAISARRD